MSRYNAQPRQPAPEFRGSKPRSTDTVMVMEPVEVAEGPKAHHVLKSFYKDLKDVLRKELGDLFAVVEVNLDKGEQTVSLEILQAIDGLHETIVIQVNRAMKGYNCLVFNPHGLYVRLNQTA